MLRANSRLRGILGDSGVEFVEHACTSIQRILPHVPISTWEEGIWQEPDSVWTSQDRTEIRMTLSFGMRNDPRGRSLTTLIKRQQVPIGGRHARDTLDMREYDICKRIAYRVAEVTFGTPSQISNESIRAIRGAFDESVIALHLEHYHQLRMSVSSLFWELRKLSEQTYENKAITFGCVLDPNSSNGGAIAAFPEEFLAAKKYKALSDGFHTAYHVSSTGHVLDFVDLKKIEIKERELTARHHVPDWAEPLARIIRDRARAQRVPSSIVGRVVGAIYRASLDVSFRRSGGTVRDPS
jgi:hypothetical protein